MTVCYLGLGSNLKNKRKNIRRALELIGAVPGTRLLKVSAMYVTRPVGGPQGQQNYVNAAAKIETDLSCVALLAKLKSIERLLGRLKGARWGPRIIDLDILFFGNRRIRRAGLQVPHPRVFEREFVKRPLSEIIW